MTLLAILAGILFACRDAAETRNVIQSEMQHLSAKIDRLGGKIDRLADRIDRCLHALRKDHTGFHAE